MGDKIYVNAGAAYRRRYGFFSFLFDATMIVLTCGFWLIWIFIREMRNN